MRFLVDLNTLIRLLSFCFMLGFAMSFFLVPTVGREIVAVVVAIPLVGFGLSLLRLRRFDDSER